MSDNNLINAIKELSIVSIIEHYVPLTKKGANFWGICPFHHDTKPSMSVNETKKMFKCFTCNVAGDAISFVAKYKEISYHQAALEIAKDFNLDPKLIQGFNQNYAENQQNNRKYELNKDYLEWAQVFLRQKNTPDGLNYLAKRQLDNTIIDHFGIGYCPDLQPDEMYQLLTNANNQLANPDPNHLYKRQELLDNGLITINSSGNVFDFFKGRVIFSIKDGKGNIIGFSGRSINGTDPKYLNTPETEIFKKNSVLYNWSEVTKIADNTDLYLVEGFMDVIALYRAGIVNAVAAMGVAFNLNHIKLIKQNPNIKNLILAFDNDAAGHEAILKNASLINQYFNLYVLKPYDQKYKDFDEVINAAGAKELQAIANDIVPYSLYYLEYLTHDYSNIPNELDKQKYLGDAIKCLKEFGNPLYLNQYLQIMSNFTHYDEAIIKKQLVFLDERSSLSHHKASDLTFETNSVTQVNRRNRRFEYSNEPRRRTKKLPLPGDPTVLLTQMSSAQQKLINASLANKEACFYISEVFSVPLDKNIQFVLGVIMEYYDQHSELTEINSLQMLELKQFIIDNEVDANYYSTILQGINYNATHHYQFNWLDFQKQVVNTEIITLKYLLLTTANKMFDYLSDPDTEAKLLDTCQQYNHRLKELQLKLDELNNQIYQN